MNYAEIERLYLNPLQAHGYFVHIVGQGQQPNTLLLECTLYLTDTGEDGTPNNPLCIGPAESIVHEGRCIACQASLMEAGVGSRQQQRGSIVCPLCSGWTLPWSIRTRKFQGEFQLIPEENEVDYIYPKGADPLNGTPRIRSKEQIELICNALSSLTQNKIDLAVLKKEVHSPLAF